MVTTRGTFGIYEHVQGAVPSSENHTARRRRCFSIPVRCGFGVGDN